MAYSLTCQVLAGKLGKLVDLGRPQGKRDAPKFIGRINLLVLLYIINNVGKNVFGPAESELVTDTSYKE